MRQMLADGIKQLLDTNIIDSRLYDWSQHLHAFRNLAAHPDMQAESITVFVYAITEYVYDLAERYEEFKERQEKRAKAKKIPPSSIWGGDD